MYRRRLFVALAIILAGVSLLPFIGLASERLGWQRYMGVYEPTPSLAINYRTGRPGSRFIVTGSDFPPNNAATIAINGHTLDGMSTDDAGELVFLLSTASDTDSGGYYVTVQINPIAGVSFLLDPDAPLRQEGTAILPAFDVPDGIAFTNFVYLPPVLR
ncbi:MAG: hypothetical protein V3S14_08690 [Anaerolineae bacterium]